MQRWATSIAGVIAAAALAIGGGGIAYADSLEAQVDSLQAGVTHVDLGSLACGSADEVSVKLFIARGGNADKNTYKSSSTVTFSKVSQTAVTAIGPTPGSVVIPSGWDDLDPNSKEVSASATSKITVTAGNSNGTFSGSVSYGASGTAADNGSLVKDLTVGVSWKVENCGTAPADGIAPVVVLTCPTEPLLGTTAVATWEATDAGGSGLKGASSGTITLDTSKYGEAIATALPGTAVDNAGNESAEVTCEYFVTENTPPVVELDAAGEFSCPAAPLILGSTADVHWTAYDPEPGSGIADDSPSSGSVPLDTGSVGSKTATVPAGTVWDDAGNESVAVDCAYSVVYDFDGFYRPVDMNGIVNSVKAGSAVPIKFSLDGDQGLDILAAGSPTITFTACNTGASIDAVEETVTAGGSSLSYDPVADQYVYVWKTAKAWAGKCGTFTLKLDDGTAHSALFTFTK